jgi:hypothetical protein
MGLLGNKSKTSTSSSSQSQESLDKGSTTAKVPPTRKNLDKEPSVKAKDGIADPAEAEDQLKEFRNSGRKPGFSKEALDAIASITLTLNGLSNREAHQVLTMVSS